MRFVSEETKQKISSASSLGQAALGVMINMLHSSSIPKPASSIVGVARFTYWIPRLFSTFDFRYYSRENPVSVP